MIVGLGIDLVEVRRLAAALERHGGRFASRVYTARERADCATRGDRVLALAARFAAKEACLKALGTGWRDGLGFRQIEVTRGPTGAPRVRLTGAAAARAGQLGVDAIHVSLTHQATVAAAVVVLERTGA
ncbi:MAG TPA: holo-ACP synthase [Candidatus Polarisedimenticolaceae bacterium]|nr:holo-ACP synthase [Candidatus Polarisedimenticolaceae bacterium]